MLLINGAVGIFKTITYNGMQIGLVFRRVDNKN